MTFKVAIIGRPNVGKSTLFNRLVGKKLALVDDKPGVTRDRRVGEAKLGDLRFQVIDTAGLEDAPVESLQGRMRSQTEAAIDEADVVLFVMDARMGVMPDDRHFAQAARRSGKPVLLLANKAEGKAGTDGAYDAFSLGLGDPLAISAEHGEGLVDLYQALLAFEVEEIEDDEREPNDSEDGEVDPSLPIRVAVVGRPNAGKSTLINRFLGEERLLVGPEAGITRDAIGLDLEWKGRTFKIFDTAGLRKRGKIEEKLEKLAVSDGIRAVKFAEVAIVLLDATIPFEKQDLSIVDLVEKEGRALVIGLNKWDLVRAEKGKLADLQEKMDRLLPQVKGAPLVPVSGLGGHGLDQLMAAVIKVHQVWNKRVSTAQLNRFLEGALSANPPPAVSGRRIKIRYMTQPKARPPYFALFGNQLDALPESWRRYLVNTLRTTFDMPGVPIRLSMRTSDNPFAKK
ncbi:MAG: ribosome biogenesis GTPase Der [Beijerinckiaceae bacterium]|nr:ribosome biogenesis GTPase Der [Beijerinckiaceae bacterium]